MASTDQISEGPPDASTPTATKFFADKDPSTFPYAHIGNYYFMFAHAQSGCGDINTTAALQSQTNNAVKALVPHLQAVPSTQTDTQYLRIKEWGVRLSLTSDTASLYYYIKPSLPNVAYFSLKTISDIAPDCAADKISLGAIARLTEAEQQAATANPSALNQPGSIHIGNYWYNAQNSHAACANSTEDAAIQKALPGYHIGEIYKSLNTLAADPTSN